MCVCMRVEEGGGVYSGERGVYSSWGGSCLSQVMDTVSYCVALMNTVSYCVVVVVVVVVLMDTVSYGVALMDAVLYSVLLKDETLCSNVCSNVLGSNVCCTAVS